VSGELPTVVVVDDAADVRGLVRTRLRLSMRFEVVADGSTGAEAIELARQHRPTVLLLDVSMPRMGGLEALPHIRACSPETRVVVYSGFDDEDLARQAVGLGAAAFISKAEALDDLPARLSRIVDGAVDPLPAPAASHDAAGERSDAAVLDAHLERFRELFEEAAIGMATMTLTGQLVRANSALARLFAQGVPNLVGTSYPALSKEPIDERFAALLAEIESGRHDVVTIEHAATAEGQTRQVLASIAPVRDVDGHALYLFLQVQDVTAQRGAEEALRQSEERFRLLVEAVEEYAIFMLDPDGLIASWNAGAQRIKGYTPGEVLGRHFRLFYPQDRQDERHPEYELEIAVRDGHYEEEGWRVRKDGSRFWANVVITALRNAEGGLVGFAKVTRDISDRRRLQEERDRSALALADGNRELEAANKRLAQSVEDQAQFLAVAAHELRTPLRIVTGASEMIAKHWPELTDVERVEMLESMDSSAARLRRLLNDLLTASRLDAGVVELDRRPVAIDELLTAAAVRARSSHADVELVVSALPEVKVLVDGDRIGQALDNVIGNAVRHGASPVELTAQAREELVEVRIADAGGGVPAEMRDRLFERFATGESRRGTGLGLFIVRELARVHGGDAWYEPPDEARAAGRFVLSLPRATAATTL